MNTTEETYPIAVLIDELKNEDVQLRLNSIKRLTTIGQALGPERTVVELIPFINESCTEDEDEVLVALAEILGDFVPIVGGPKKASCLIAPLKTLCNVEEATVREKAIASINKIASQMKNETIEETCKPLVKELANGEWFTSRSSSCGLFSILYPVVSNEVKTELRNLYAKLCKDETPMVRRAAFTHLGTFATKVSDHLITYLIPIFTTLSQDGQDSVRLLAVENCVAFGKLLKAEDVEKYLLPVIKNCSKDKSWRVRYMVANQFKNLCSSIPISKDMVESFIDLCKDAEAEVRTAAAEKVSDVSSFLPKNTIISSIIPAVKCLVTDKSEHVRAALGSVIMGLAPVLEKDGTKEHLLPIFLQLLKDTFPDVRLNIISKLDAVNKVVGVELLAQSLLPAIVELAEDKQWRVRLAIIEYIPLLASQLGEKFFDDTLNELCMTWLVDSVYSIREAATNNLKKLTQVFGYEWCEKNLLPKVLAMHTNPNYLYRMTTLFSINVLIPFLPQELITDKILKVVVTLVQDPVPNVRFNAIKTMETMIGYVKSDIVSEFIKPTIQSCQEDKDSDVRFFVTQALQKC